MRMVQGATETRTLPISHVVQSVIQIMAFSSCHLVEFLVSTLISDVDLISAFIGKVGCLSWVQGSPAWYFYPLCFRFTVATDLQCPCKNLLLWLHVASIIRPRQHPGRSGWVSPCFQSWDTSHWKNLFWL